MGKKRCLPILPAKRINSGLRNGGGEVGKNK